MGEQTDDNIDLLRTSNILAPCAKDCDVPMYKLPIEHIDSRTKDFPVVARNVGVCNMGNTGWKRVKYI